MEYAYHPAYHELMRIGIEARTHSLPWIEQRSGPHVARAALALLRHQIERHELSVNHDVCGDSVAPVQPELATEWEPLALSSIYDPRSIPASQKGGALLGWA